MQRCETFCRAGHLYRALCAGKRATTCHDCPMSDTIFNTYCDDCGVLIEEDNAPPQAVADTDLCANCLDARQRRDAWQAGKQWEV